VRLQLLTACVKLFLKSPQRGEAQQMVQSVLSMSTECTDDPDLRDRGYIYWRLLSNDPEAAKAIVLGPKPPVEDDTAKLDEATLDLLLSQIGTLASVYHKPPEAFVNEKNLKEEEEEETYDDFDDAPADDEPAPQQEGGGDLLDLLDMGPVAAAVPEPKSGGDALVADALGDIFGGDPVVPQPSGGDIFGGADLMAAPQNDPFGGSALFGANTPPPAPAPLRKPVSVLQPSPQSGGIGIAAAFNAGEQRTIALDLEVSNAGPQPVRLLQIQLNKSPFGLAPADQPSLSFDPPLLPGTTRPKRVRLRAGDAKMLSQVPAMTAGAGVNVQIALKNADTGAVFYLAAPCPLDAVFAADATVDRSAFIARWKAIDDANESYATVADLPTGPSIDAAVAKLAARRCHPVARRAVPGQVGSEVAYFSVQLLGPQAEYLVELTFKSGVAACKVCVKTTARSLAPLGLAAICALLRAP
jgi:AP-1 complex subunit beta-1